MTILQRLYRLWKRSEEPKPEESPRQQTGTILVADDEPNVRYLIQANLKRHGYSVLTAADGTEAWRIMQEQPIALFLVRKEMSEQEDGRLLRQMRQSETLRRVVIVQSGYFEQQFIRWSHLDFYNDLPFCVDSKFPLQMEGQALLERVDSLLKLTRPSYRVTPEQQGRGQTVLVVDDERSIVRFVTVHLECAGYAVVTAANGVEAWDRLNEQPVDAMVTDFYMPEMDGGELIQAVRRDKMIGGLPITVMSGRPPDAPWPESVSGANRFVTKPFNPQEIISCLSGLLSPKQNTANYDLS